MLAAFRTKTALCIGIAAAVAIVAIFIGFLILSNRNQQVLAGQNIVVTVTADSLEYVYGYQFRINYNKDELEYTEYTGSLTTKIDEFQAIYSHSREDFELVGATMVGDKSGVSGKNKTVCKMVFTAKKDTTLADLVISISDVCVVQTLPDQSDLDAIEGVEGWKLKCSVKT